MNKNKVNVKDISIAALLTALALAIPTIMPFKLIVEPIFSATFAAHVPGILAMFISPFAVVGTAVGSALGFLVATGNLAIVFRAFSHFIFGLLGYKMLTKKMNIFLVAALTGIIHAAAEIVVAIISFKFVGIPENATSFLLVTVGCGTFIHHCVDFAISIAIIFALKSARLLKTDINIKSLKG